MDVVWLILLGAGVGCFGTLIGAGGGFVLAPVLFFMHPDARPEQLTAVSLAVVCANAIVGTFTYWRRGRVDVRSALMFAAAAVPAAVVGVWVNGLLPRKSFAIVLGVFLLAGSVFLLRKPLPKAGGAGGGAAAGSGGNTKHEEPTMTDPLGPHVVHNHVKGTGLAAAVGLISSILGIGGGILHVPALVHVLGFPVHLATATSHMVLAITAGVATGIHLYTGALKGFEVETMWLALGAVIGSPVGAALSRRVAPAVIIRSLAVALGLVGARVLWAAVRG